MVVLLFLVHDIVGALCPHNKLLQLLESKQRQQATNPARCHRRIGGTNPSRLGQNHKFVASEIDKWAGAIKASGVQID